MIYVIVILLIVLIVLMLGGRSMALQRLAAMGLTVSVVILIGYIYAYHASVGSIEKQYMLYTAKCFERSDNLLAELDDRDFSNTSEQEALTQWIESAIQENLWDNAETDGKQDPNVGIYTETIDGYNRVFFMGSQSDFDETAEYKKAVYPLMSQAMHDHGSAQVVVNHEYGVLIWADADATISRNVMCIQIPVPELAEQTADIRDKFIKIGWSVWGLAMLLIVVVIVIQNREWKSMVRVVSAISAGKEDWKKPRIHSSEMQIMWNSLSELVKNTAKSNYEKYRTLRAYYRFAPKQVERILGCTSVAEVAIGDYANINGIMVLAQTEDISVESRIEFMQALNQKYTVLNRHREEQQGILISGDSDLQAMKFLFLQEAAQAAAFGINAVREMDSIGGSAQGKLIMFAHRSEYLYGITGDEEQALTFLASEEWKLLEPYSKKLLAAGVRMAVTDSLIDAMPQDVNCRYLGYVGTEQMAFKLYEVLDACPELERRRKLKADEKFQQGIRLFYKDDYYLARNAFSDALKECPEDHLIKWYLFICEHYLDHPEMEYTSYALFHDEV